MSFSFSYFSKLFKVSKANISPLFSGLKLYNVFSILLTNPDNIYLFTLYYSSM